MSILKEVIKEAAYKEMIESAAAGATSAGAVAGFAAPLGASPKTFGKKSKKKHKTRMQRRAVPGMSNFYFVEGIEDQKFDQADVISKLRAAEKRAENEEDTRGFALEDEDGKIVKVYVAADQAKDFEQALAAALAGEETDEFATTDTDSSSLEIAEVLFNLKDRFTIVDVEWPQVEEDEEEPVEGSEEELSDEIEGETEGDEPDMEAELQGDEEMGDEMPSGGEEMSALQSIIDLLKSQAEAQKAEAQAKEASANAEEAKYNAMAAEAKVKQEEEVLDMEAYYDEKNKVEKEAKQLAKLAKWKHETAQDAEKELSTAESADVDSMDEEEEASAKLLHVFKPKTKTDHKKNRHLEPGEFIKYMFKSVQRMN